MSTFSQGYALLIGVDHHSVPAWSLPAVAKDIDAVHAVLIHPQRCAYLPDHVRVLHGNTATRAAILDGLDWLQQQIAADPSGNATALVYYSGHGWRNATTAAPAYYLIPHDTQQQPSDLQPKPATALRADDFAAAIAALNPQRLLVLLDCCHAAGLDVKELAAFASTALPVEIFLPTAGQSPATADAKGLAQLATGHGRAILSSSQGVESSYIRPDGAMSIFTYHLIEALTGHAQPQSGATAVLVSDMVGHVHRHVPTSARALGKVQQPDYALTGNFPVALLLGGKGIGTDAGAPDPLAALPPVAATYQSTNTGSGAIAQGTGAVAAGERGVAIGGRVSGSTIITGDGNKSRR